MSFVLWNLQYKLFFFFIEYALPFVIQDLLCFLFLLSVYLKGTCISRKLSNFNKNSSKEKSILPRLVLLKHSSQALIDFI